MGLLDRLFGTSRDKVAQPDVRFGRYSDSYKTVQQYDAWEASLDRFDEEQYLESYRAFFQYLRDEQENNVRCWEADGGIRFELYQGSKKITGFANDTALKAEAKVATAKKLNVGFMRRLIEQNTSLEYSRFALDPDNNIAVVFDTYNLDGSPYKLYYALKELAVHADKQDDLLVDEFEMVDQIETSHLEALPDSEKEVKYHFIRQQIEAVLREIDKSALNPEQYPGAIAYLLLNLTYKLDYLIKPEGYTMETLERVHRQYFAKDNRTTPQKNVVLRREFQRLYERPKDDFFKEMYRVKATFGITSPVNHDRVVAFIDGELHNMDWYKEHGHEAVAMAISGYIIGYCMFNYAVPQPDRDFFHLYFQITEQDYFQSLGFNLNFYDNESGKFNKRAIRRAIDDLVDKNDAQYARLNPAVNGLRYDSLPDFAKSYLLMVRNLNMTKTNGG